MAVHGPDNDSLQDVEKAMAGLAAIDGELPVIVELKVFEGLTMEQIAGRLDCSERTAARRWNFARNWLSKYFDAGGKS
jgi:DNA-directed RNA polymerase specialized sigma24 family protein